MVRARGDTPEKQNRCEVRVGGAAQKAEALQRPLKEPPSRQLRSQAQPGATVGSLEEACGEGVMGGGFTELQSRRP